MWIKFERISPGKPWTYICEMSAMPREGESIAFDLDSASLQIRAVIWCPMERDYQAIVRFA